jgi:hypothetical protein
MIGESASRLQVREETALPSTPQDRGASTGQVLESTEKR